jgi:hypothetical protein
MRVQLVVALVAGLVLVAVPLYLWRRPKAAKTEAADAGADSAVVDAGPPPDAGSSLVAAALDGGSVTAPGITLDKVRIVKCQRPGPSKTAPEQCDRQPFFEESLVKAILENVSCAPKAPKGGSISFALKVDHKKRSTRLWAGESGSIRHKRAASTIECVKRSLPAPSWDSIAHQHTSYVIAVQATYPPSEK